MSDLNKEWLVFCTTCGDGYTYSFEKFIPFQYSSKKDAEHILLEYAYELLELYVTGMNGSDPEWDEYYQWLEENPFFSDFKLGFDDLWYYNKFYDFRNPPKNYKASDYELVSFQIYTLQEWSEANEEKVKYSSKVV